MICPTGTTSPTFAVTPPRTPSACASISTTALSVSTSRSISPLATCSPSFFFQETSFPVSWAISRAGMTTLTAIVVVTLRCTFTTVALWSVGASCSVPPCPLCPLCPPCPRAGFYRDAPTPSDLALASISWRTSWLGGASISRVEGSGPSTVT